MLALIASCALVAYVLVPGALFRLSISPFFPLKKFQRTRSEELTFAAFAAALPFLLALVLVWTGWSPSKHPFAFPDTAAQRRADYKTLFASAYSEYSFSEHETDFWPASTRIVRRQGRMLAWYYAFLVVEAIGLGWLGRDFGRLQGHRAYRWLAERVLFPSISEWHILLTPFTLAPGAERRVMVDILTSDDHLYRGRVGDYFVDRQGKLSGILLKDALRFDRRSYLRDQDASRAQALETYWKELAGANLYVFADKIANLNLNYDPVTPVPELIGRILAKLGIPGRVTAEDSSE